MLKLPQEHTNDKKANTIIVWYLNWNILGLIKDVVTDYEDIHEKESQEDDPVFWEEVSSFFLECYPKEKWGKYSLDCRRFWNRNMNLFRNWSWNSHVFFDTSKD